jgi:hypothetical protein
MMNLSLVLLLATFAVVTRGQYGPDYADDGMLDEYGGGFDGNYGFEDGGLDMYGTDNFGEGDYADSPPFFDGPVGGMMGGVSFLFLSLLF